jgi:hypothetical protein
MSHELSSVQVRYLLKLIEKEHGPGYADAEAVLEDGTFVGALQANLSIRLQMAGEREGRRG